MQSKKIEIVVAISITAIIVSSVWLSFYKSPSSEITNFEQKNTALTLSSKEYAIMGSQMWGAFSCSVWASHINDTNEAERLFLFGYSKGQTFLKALKADKIEQKDISSEVPIGVTLSLQGPTEEFILGRIHSLSEEEALDEVFKNGNDFNSEEMQKIIAGNKFRDGNCQLVGK
ncbi:MAG: hypothetical protein A2561_02060 [Candidatus Staskawiczbacteria bacterium RIFOXYD1_FULL_32_13]|uniref:Uncharacterized protein n=1 Tax=Candidatus Staskawiczbacteria bacterium RIFOXYD1_FULL_32_13 TaxID=1802234 RepID=A0A1G2JPH6_9BACT|nr:MAG: hypothetical protein UR22_C0004G0053 [Parcubacteria group bacterium GW2011_GWC2_32_10]OGZ86539.1 MAG: hypothetical protein A2463_04220 [Candidatus Staskawiczbacteria bacterium RIFOXYC2_FULL_32_10]OGZ88361.1 MAG: hypothetical protein A2561_02060 [Candidatus Staskawiczbacteria bacterium RIFOXYD1_FULL_32_13]